MSAGKFTRSFYQADDDEIFLARVQPETINGFNVAPAGPATVGISANMTGGQRQNGVNARYILGAWQVGAAPVGYEPEGTVKLPILTKTSFDAINKGDALAYLGGTFVVTGKTSEKLV